MSTERSEALTSSDWYRVRRGEDELAWGRCRRVDALPEVRFSRRAGQELAFLEPDQRESVVQCLREVLADPCGRDTLPVLRGAGRRMTRLGKLKAVYQLDAETGQVLVSTIRGGKVVDPEAVGPPPKPPVS